MDRALIWFAVLVSLLLFLATAGQPFHLDNMDFPAVAKATSETGLPVYYRGEENPVHLGLYHPPLYIYLLAGWIRLFGFGEVQIRLFGYLCLLAQFFLAFRILALLFGKEYVRPWAPVILLGFLPHAYALQTASITDIDSTIYGPILLAVFYFVLSLSWRDGVWREESVTHQDYAAISVLLAISLWAKLTTSLLTFFVLPLLLVPKLRWRRALLASVSCGVGGILLFGVTYWLYGNLTGLDIGYTFSFAFDSFLHRGAIHARGLGERLAAYVSNFPVMFTILLHWTGALPVLTAGLGCGVTLLFAIRRKDAALWHAFGVLGTALFVTLYYCAQMLTFAKAPFKYVFPYWSVLAVSPIVLAKALELKIQFEGRQTLWSLATAYLVGIGAGLLLLKDQLLFYDLAPRTVAFLWKVPALVMAAAGLLLFVRRSLAGHFLALSVLLAGGMACGVARYQAGVDYSTTYDYGQRGLREAAAVIKALTGPEDRIVSMKDLGFLVGRRYIENYGAVYVGGRSMETVVHALRSGSVALAVFTEESGQDQLVVNPTLKQAVESNSCLVYIVGNYRIYRPFAAKTTIPLACIQTSKPN